MMVQNVDPMEQLIEEVKKRPCLYNPKLEEYRDNQIKDDVWEEIATTLNRDCRTIRQEWKRLRDCFRQATARRKSTSLSRKRWKPWRYEKQMEFAAPYINSKVATTNATDIQKGGDEDLDEDVGLALVAVEMAEEKEPSSSSPVEAERPETKYTSSASGEHDFESPSAVLDDLPQETETNAQSFRNHTCKKRKVVAPHSNSFCTGLPDGKLSDQDDDLDLFFRSACLSTRRLPRKLQNQIKRDLLDSILSAEELYEGEVPESKNRDLLAISHLHCCNNN
ncbi:uncharacterized protein LOC135209873 [Macrobrachium nipponense]|uniref:uncharacterized protein LOC135209873 n=1 Tax=Macrobrachium nipponense TaxID=159736 RepID=UPI0030C8ADF8